MESTAAQSWMEKGSHCLYLLGETDFVNSLVLGPFWLPRNYISYLSCTVFVSDPVPEMGKTVQTSQPWSPGHVSESLLCQWGSRDTRHHCQNVPYFLCCAENSSQYCVHFLFWNFFIEDNFLLLMFVFFSWGPLPFSVKTRTVKDLKKSFYSRFLMQMSSLELNWKRMLKWTSLPHHPFPLNFSKPSIQIFVLVFWWREKLMWKFMSVWSQFLKFK